jgi:hypothetical protein
VKDGMVNFTIVPQYDEKAFSADVIARWGDIEPELQREADTLHMQMMQLAWLCKEAPERATEIFSFLETVVDRPDVIAEIENAVAISFVEWPDAQELAKTQQLSLRVLDIIRDQDERCAERSK